MMGGKFNMMAASVCQTSLSDFCLSDWGLSTSQHFEEHRKQFSSAENRVEFFNEIQF